MNKIDFHAHSGLRSLFRNEGRDRKTPWDELTVTLPLFRIMDTQASFNQLLDGGVRLVVIAIYPPEKEILANWKIKGFDIGNTWMDSKRRSRMISGEDSYYSVGNDEISNLTLSNPNNRKFHLLRSFNDFKPTTQNTLFGILSLEGGHILYGESHKIPGRMEWMVRLNGLINLGYLISHMTLTHVTKSIFANFAYAIKQMKNSNFQPRGYGITDEGWELIKCLDKEKICIDIKHLSRVSRMQIMERQNPLPIVCSHCAFAGFAWNNLGDAPFTGNITYYAQDVVKVKYDPIPGHLNNTYFLPTSINLYDEEIRWIAENKGMIGLILDKRILGSSKRSKEFVSFKEFEDHWYNLIFPNNIDDTIDNNIHSVNEYDEINDDWDTEEEEDNNPLEPTPNYSISKYINQLIHYAKVTEGIVNRWDHICLGSDYDGMISPLPKYPNAGNLDEFETDLRNNLLPMFQSVNVAIGIQADELVQKLLYDNSFNFLKNHFSTKL